MVFEWVDENWLRLFTGVVIAMGVLLILGGITGFIRAVLTWRNEVLPTVDLPAPGESVELEGTATQLDDTAVSAYTDTPSLVASFQTHQRDGDSSWEMTEGGTSSVPFLLEDGYGQAVIDPSHCHLEAAEHTEERSEGEMTIRETERRIEPGDPVHIIGEVFEPLPDRDDLGGRQRYVGGSQYDMIQISEGTERDVVRRQLEGAGAFIASGIVLIELFAGYFFLDRFILLEWLRGVLGI